ncbi:hypothetical protein [Micromonospora sp. NPDC005413]|uniref:hypothetical protein n=1 Tax=Micromonospora sp. NPDC005413 TaxID=3154563 RepID=UPI0033AE2B0F
MVSRRAAELLLEMAARRWPVDIRDDLRREWAAELHVLAESGRRTKMVGFAVSLAVSRAGAPLVDRSMMHRRARRTAAALLLSPLVCALAYTIRAARSAPTAPVALAPTPTPV